MAFGKETSIRCSRVFHSGGKGIFRSKAIVWSEYAEAVHCERCGDRTVRLCRTAEISAAMQIKEHVFADIWRFHPLSGNAVHLNRRNAYRRRHFVRIGPENLARATIIAAAFQAALDAPLHNPNREMRLKTSHGLLRTLLECNTGEYQISTKTKLLARLCQIASRIQDRHAQLRLRRAERCGQRRALVFPKLRFPCKNREEKVGG